MTVAMKLGDYAALIPPHHGSVEEEKTNEKPCLS